MRMTIGFQRVGKLMVIVALLLALQATVGCKALEYASSADTLCPNNPTWFSYNAERRGGLLVPVTVRDTAINTETTTWRTLSEPAPDVAMAETMKALAKVKIGDDEGNAEASYTRTVVELGKRTQMVMFIREALFRLSELSFNSTMGEDKLKDMYDGVVEMAANIAIIEVETQRTELARTLLQAAELAELAISRMPEGSEKTEARLRLASTLEAMNKLAVNLNQVVQ